LGKLTNILFGTPEERKRKATLKQKEKEALWEGYSKGRIESARKRGYEKGKGKSKRKGQGGSIFQRLEKGLGTVQGGIEGMGLGAKGYMKFLGFDLGPKTAKRKKKKRKRKR